MHPREIYVSTGSFRVTTEQAVQALQSVGLARIELSGGPVTAGVLRYLSQLCENTQFQLHNYFPVLGPPYVFNLASTDPAIRGRTIDNMLMALEISHFLGATRYGVHAGFLVDPPVKALGNTWDELPRSDVAQAKDLFLTSVFQLATFANDLGIELMIENNVLTSGTCQNGGPDVLLMASSADILELAKDFPKGAGVLLDVAHLKVTSQTLGLDPVDEITRTNPEVVSYHLSDNDGTTDSNQPVSEESWFWPHLKPEILSATLEVSPDGDVDLVAQLELARSCWHSDGDSSP